MHIADPWIGGVDVQRGFREGTEQVNGRPFHLAAVEPLIVILRTENGGHAVVDGAHMHCRPAASAGSNAGRGSFSLPAGLQNTARVFE